jgi:tRNA-modifying protein YgfZ
MKLMTNNQKKVYDNALTNTALYERSDFSILRAKGNDVLDFLNRMTTNDVSKLTHSTTGIQTVATTDKGRIVDVLTVLPSSDSYLLLYSKTKFMDVVSWLRKYIIADDVRFSDESSSLFTLEVLGPKSTELIHSLSVASQLPNLIGEAVNITVDGAEGILTRIPSVSEVSYLFIGGQDFISTVKNVLTQVLETSGYEDFELDDNLYEIIRIEKGMAKSPNELNEMYNPLEAGLLHLINFKKGCYIGQEVIARLDTYNKVKQRLVGVKLSQYVQVPSEITIGGNTVGQLTSITEHSSHGLIGLGYIRNEHIFQDVDVVISKGDNQISGTIHILPFTS